MLGTPANFPMGSKMSSDTNCADTARKQVQRAIRICVQHAEDLLSAAKLLASKKPYNIAYHLGVLALEEVGKAGLIMVGNMPGFQSERSLGRLERSTEDHVKKLFFALWGPSFGKERITPQQVKEFQNLARAIHETRLQGLYVAIKPEFVVPPRERVSKRQVENILRLVEARIGMEKTTRLRKLTPDDLRNVEWFTSAADDPEQAKLMFGGKSLEKLKALNGDARAWIRWMHEQFEQADKESKELLARELSREEPKGNDRVLPKWKLKVRLETTSHSIRQNVLKGWNDKVDQIKLHTTNRKSADMKGELIVEYTLPRSIPIQGVWRVGWDWIKQLVVALNLATRGFFWWHVPRDADRFYEEIEDLDSKSKVGVERRPALRLNWGNRVLDGGHLNVAVQLFVRLVRDRTGEYKTAIERYVFGLALMSKSDIHLQFEPNMFMEFFEAWKNALITFHDWDGTGDLISVADRVFGSFIPGFTGHKELIQMAEELKLGKCPPQKVTLTEVGAMKVLCDVYLSNRLLRTPGPNKRPRKQNAAKRKVTATTAA